MPKSTMLCTRLMAKQLTVTTAPQARASFRVEYLVARRPVMKQASTPMSCAMDTRLSSVVVSQP